MRYVACQFTHTRELGQDMKRNLIIAVKQHAWLHSVDLYVRESTRLQLSAIPLDVRQFRCGLYGVIRVNLSKVSRKLLPLTRSPRAYSEVAAARWLISMRWTYSIVTRNQYTICAPPTCRLGTAASIPKLVWWCRDLQGEVTAFLRLLNGLSGAHLCCYTLVGDG